MKQIEELADTLTAGKSRDAIKKAIVKSIPRQAVLKPAHAVYRLQNQHFALGDRVTMVQDSGGVPLSIKGVVIGMNAKSMDIVWDVPFMSGTTLGDRCALLHSHSRCMMLTQVPGARSTAVRRWTSPRVSISPIISSSCPRTRMHRTSRSPERPSTHSSVPTPLSVRVLGSRRRLVSGLDLRSKLST